MQGGAAGPGVSITQEGAEARDTARECENDRHDRHGHDMI
jgi:hypothetical protein